MAELFYMPKLGMDMEEGTVVNWLKAEGEAVKKGEALAEIETDKSTVEVESPAEGIILKLFVEKGDCRPCGTPIACIGAAGEPVPDVGAAPAEKPPVQAAESAAPAPQPAPAAAPAAALRPVAAAPVQAALTPGGRIRSSPRARRLAEKNGVPLDCISGSGSEGRIVEADVRRFMESGKIAGPARPVRVPVETIRPVTGVRKVTARRMFQSLSTTAQTNLRVDINVAALQSFRQQLNARWEKKGMKVSFMDLLTAACARALIENPQANAYWAADGIRVHNYANIGIAVDTPKGLVVPVVREADVLSLPEISEKSKGLIEKARQGRLTPDDMSGGTFTISNLGMLGVDSFTAILNPPETCILAVGRIVDKVVAENGAAVIRPIMNLCLTYDHQILDGADAARFLQSIRGYLENPVWLLLQEEN